MGIGGINDYSSLLHNYRVPSIPSVSVEEVKRQEQENKLQQNTSQLSPTLEEQPVVRAPRKDAALEDISLTFNKGDDFGTIGRDADIHSLDVENALSDMKKDSVLQQYQYFVGNQNTSGALVNNADGLVIPKYFQ